NPTNNPKANNHNRKANRFLICTPAVIAPRSARAWTPPGIRPPWHAYRVATKTWATSTPTTASA
ncbi:hypothetical protein AAGG49_21955, partial [Stenotrophomonas maltophilia]|uniref:hypothetical protein n=1 Tax=Stenotrophomonas maltophilia TaxID=40324 RepID=UPI00313D4281